MAGYTRQSTASILNGQAITAPPLTAEFNQLASAFSSTSGHSHDGTSGNSPKINLATSVSGFLPAANGGIGGQNKSDATAAPVASNDTSEGYAVGSLWTNVSTGRVYICIVNTTNAAVWRELVQVKDGNSILPVTNDSIDLGSNALRFQDLFLSGGISSSGNSAIGGTLSVTGNTTVGGTLGVTGAATFVNLTATGTTTITSVDLNSGAVDNAPIGTTTPAAGTFTTLNANTSLVAATADINGGTVDGATIGANTPSTGSFTTLGASGTTTLATVDINGGAIDGTAIGAASATTGAFTTVSTSGQATLATVDINGGAIDGATIGASSTSSGAFTTLSASGTITGALTGNVTGNTAGVHTGAVTGNVTGNLTGNVTASSGSSTFNDVVVNGNLNMNAGTSATITNLTAPSADLDAATKKYVDDEISTLVGDAGAGLNTLGELADALNDDDDFSTTVTNSIASKLPKAGGTMTGAIAMGTSKITGLGDPTANQDAATKAYTDTQRDTRLATSGGTMSGALAMGNQKITGLGTPTATTDATTKTYVDGLFQSTTAAATSATNAGTSETNAGTSATNANNSATAAASSATSAAASFDLFDDRMLGAKSSAPSVDNDGNALVAGTLYFDTTASAMKVYSGSGWVNAGSSVNGTTNRYSYTATAGQTTFAATYDAGYVDVFLNGVKQVVGTDVTATSGSSVVFASGTTVNDVVEIIGYGTFVLADHLTQTQSDARYVNLSGNTMTGDLTVPNLVVTGTVDGVDIAARDAVLTSTTTTAGAALPLAGGALTGNLSTTGQIDINTASSGLPTLKFSHTNAGADNFQIGGGIPGTSNSGFSIRDVDASANRFVINSSGNVGIGTSAPVSLSSQTSLTINGTSVARIDLQGTGQIYANSTEVVLQGAYGKPVAIDAGTNQHISFRYATAEKMRLDSSGRLLLGTTSTYFADADDLVVAGSGNQGITIASGTSSDGNIFFADGTSGDARYMGIVRYNHSDNAMKFYTNGANERMRIDSSGQIIAGPFGGAGNAVIAGSSSPSYTNQAGTNLLLKSGDGSGTGSSFMSFSTSPAGSSGTTVNTATERMRIDSSGRVGIGTTTPTGKVEIQGPAIGSGNVDHDHFKALKLSLADGTEWGGQAQFSVGRWQEDGNNARSTLQLALGNGQQNSDSNADTVIFTALSHGRVVFSPTGAADGQGVTTYANGTNGHYVSVTGTSNYWITNHGVSSATGTLSTFYNNSTYCGGINISSTNVTSYVSASDYRLKENVVPMTGATERLKQLNPVTFDWINSGESSEGFIAHEVGAVVPISTTGTKDEVYDEEGAADNPKINEGDPKYQSVDPAKLVPLLVKTIQELEARITVLEGG